MEWKPVLITTERGTFECFVAGKGKPICVAHLYQQFSDKGNPFIDVLSDYYKVIAVNLKGTGKSSKPRRKSDLSMDETVNDLESIRTSMNYSQWSYAGHSTGGFLGLKYATVAGSHLEALILSGTAASRDFQYSEKCLYNFKTGQYRKEMGKLWFFMMMPFNAQKVKARRRLLELSLFHPEKYNDYFIDEIGSEVVGKRMRAYIQDLKTFDVREQLKTIHLPTLVLCGRHDVQCPVETSIEINSLIPNSDLVIFEQSNHFPFIEEAVEFRKAIEGFA
ncbi:alpha/beta fold hydrolase [Alicyclobacillus sp. SO9]|uniref:alpha/beta fold hydrolase n=1 Tax=Alicyclobacillus sp. SO9 TaxID=2665646 RepID=UPI0018E90A98|nr:alpha/beta hydrolase [Alicyclobacillus sp. SO9]QQE78329.1 alpha/beta hydrolase [Alicyclobacillus sp. SO9]